MNINEWRIERGDLKEELKKARMRVGELQKSLPSLMQRNQQIRAFKAVPLPVVQVDPVSVETEDVELGLASTLAEGGAVFERIGTCLQKLMKKFEAGMSLPSLCD